MFEHFCGTVNSADYQSKFFVRKTTIVLTLAIMVYLTIMAYLSQIFGSSSGWLVGPGLDYIAQVKKN